MVKRSLLLFLAFLVLLAVPALACIHTDTGEIVDEDLVEANRIPAQPGVAGSVDIVCPVCREVIEHVVLPPLPAEAEHPASSDAETSAPVVPQETIREPEPEPQPQPEPPPQSEQPAQLVQPAQPAQPEASAQPVQPAQPAQPAARPETPVQPAQPAQPVQPAQSETPAKPVTPAEPARSEDPAPQSGGSAVIPAAGTGSNAPAAAPAAEPQKAQEVIANVPPETASTAGTGGTATGSSGGGAARQAGRAKISGGGEEAAVPAEKPQTFPFRRIKMKPKPGIRAEAAGELLWPVFGTPFQNIYND